MKKYEIRARINFKDEIELEDNLTSEEIDKIVFDCITQKLDWSWEELINEEDADGQD